MQISRLHDFGLRATSCVCICASVLIFRADISTSGTSEASVASTVASAIFDDVTQRIEALLQTQVDCWNDGDIDGFMQTYWNSEDLTFSSSGKTTRGWKATLERYKTNYNSREKMGFLRFSDLEIIILSEDKVAAMVLGTWELSFADSSETAPMRGKFTLVLKQLEGDWKIIHDHTSVLANPK
ncbi:MAG TPA: nuclear transport factor 2 family protein [Pirellulaceae bacterium]|nr:nuclear transport factor 2 family protein [Pirellulaceae bacterium]HMO91111.1 nuclear transport factor 2 family protein [Pirellulaceae bacterium]HMP70542.1 nuclear transport factor 2 family protein [Pirellulaceae bacterium]